MLFRGIIFYLSFLVINSNFAGSFITGDNTTISYSETPTNIIITGSSVGASGNIVIPDYINDLPVTVISVSAFGLRSNISSFELPSTLETIERYAFGDTSITNIHIPDNVTSIGSYAFYGCENLESINIPLSLTHINNHAFYNCENLSDIGNILNSTNGSLVSIGQRAFRNTNLENIIIPNSVINIGNHAFEYCSNLVSVTFGSSITNIEDKAFFMCKSLESITFTSHYPPQFGSEVFYEYWPNLDWGDTRGISGARVTVPYMSVNYGPYGQSFEGLPKLNSSPFSYIINEQTNEITLTDCHHNALTLDIPLQINGLDVTALNGTFYNAYNNAPGGYVWSGAFENIIIPSNIVHIGSNTFRNNYIRNVVFPNSVTNIGSYAFYQSGVRNIEIPGSVSVIKPYAFANTYLTNIVFSEGLTNIENNAFEDTIYLDNIIIPNSVTNIGEYAFHLSRIKSIEIPGSVSVIKPYAFANTYLTNIVLHEGIMNIENDAFEDNFYLEKILIPDTVTNISDNAFYDCSALKTVTLSSNLVSIGDSVFRQSFSLSNIVFRSQLAPSYIQPGNGNTYTFSTGYYNNAHSYIADVPEFGSGYGDFQGTLPGYDNITVKGLTPLSYIINADNTAIITECDNQISGNVIIPASINGSVVTGIAEQAFDGCALIKSVEIPNSIQMIDSQAFLGCSDLERIVIDNENLVINKNVFDQCNKLNILEFKENEFLLLFNNPSDEIPNMLNLINSIIPIGKSYVTNNPSSYNLYKLSEINDLRPSSTLISTSNNTSELSFALEESINLINWHTNQLIEVNLPTTNNIKFFRFRPF